MIIDVYDSKNIPGKKKRDDIVDFLFNHLEEFGDPRADIDKAVAFALKEVDSFGGFVLGAVVVNRTGMKDYIPEHILVYIATHKEQRGKGIGKKLMKKAAETATGNIALHVEPDNPARFLYEKVGYTSKYIEMRLLKEKSV